MTRTALYRFFGEGGTLLYVGITDDTHRRWTEHAHSKPWWPNVTRKSVEWFDTRAEAATAELLAIKTEGPAHNFGTPGSPEAAARVQAAYEKLLKTEEWAEQMRRDVRVRFGHVANEIVASGVVSQEEVADQVGKTREWVRRLQVKARNAAKRESS